MCSPTFEAIACPQRLSVLRCCRERNQGRYSQQRVTSSRLNNYQRLSVRNQVTANLHQRWGTRNEGRLITIFFCRSGGETCRRLQTPQPLTQCAYRRKSSFSRCSRGCPLTPFVETPLVDVEAEIPCTVQYSACARFCPSMLTTLGCVAQRNRALTQQSLPFAGKGGPRRNGDVALDNQVSRHWCQW